MAVLKIWDGTQWVAVPVDINDHDQYVLKVASTDNAIVRMDGTGGAVQDSAFATLGDTGILSIHSAGAAILGAFGHGTLAQAAVDLQRSLGTQAVPLAINSGNDLGRIDLWGHDGASYQLTARIAAEATENFSVGNEGTRLYFRTTPNGAAGMVTRLYIEQDGTLALEGNNIANVGTTDGRDLSGADGPKLDGIEALADVTDTANVLAAIEALKTGLTCISFMDDGVRTSDRNLLRSALYSSSHERYNLPYDGEIIAVTIHYQISVDGGAGVDIDWDLDIGGVNQAAATMTYTGGSGVAYYDDKIKDLSISFSEDDYITVRTNHLAAGNSVLVHGYDIWVRFKE